MESPIAEIKPNIKKAFLSNILFVSLIVAAVIATLVYLNNVVGLDVFIITFKEIGITISPSKLLAWFIIFILFITALLLILNYIVLAKISYTLYPDKILYGRSFFIVQLTSQEIPYSNISKVSYESTPLLHTAKVVLSITGMKRSKIEIEYIDNAPELVNQLQNLINTYRANYYAKYSEDYRYQNIMDQM